MIPRHALWLALALGACGSKEPEDSGAGSDSETPTDSDTEAETGPGTPPDTGRGTDTVTDTDTGEASPTDTAVTTGADSGLATPTDIGTDTGPATTAHTGGGTGTHTGTGLGAPAHTGTGVGTGTVSGSDTAVDTSDTSIDTAPDAAVDTADTARSDTAAVPTTDSAPGDTWTATGGADTHRDTGLPNESADTAPLDTGDTGGFVVDTGDTGTESVNLTLDDAEIILLGEAAFDFAGGSVTSAGDVNGDGYEDLLIGAYGNDTTGALAGTAYLLHGPIAPGEHNLSAADAIIRGRDADDWTGFAVAPAGDVNGDGFDDILVGAPMVDFNGAAYLLHGPVSGEISVKSAFATYIGQSADDDPGYEFAHVAGDLTGNGVPDIVLGTPGYVNPFLGQAGRIYIVEPTAAGTQNLALADAVIEGDFGQELMYVVSVSDFSGDGVQDIVMGAPLHDNIAPGAGALLWQQGPFSGVHYASGADGELYGSADHDLAGNEVDARGDINGDGSPDIAVGAPQSWYGSAGGLVYIMHALTGSGDIATAANATLISEGLSDQLGLTICSASDFDDDGFADVLVGATEFGGYDGASYVIPGPVSGSLNVADAAVRVVGNTGDQAGWIGCADATGDATPDILVGARWSNRFATDAGAVFVFSGRVVP